jgi:uncharacterized protein YijF (DUF1287 family)
VTRGPGAGALTRVSTVDLERLAVDLAHAAPDTNLSKAALAAARLGHLWEDLQTLGILQPAPLSVLIHAVLCERAAQPTMRVDLVWTGLEAKTAYARPTATVLRELFEQAERHVLIAGYSFDHGTAIFEPLHAVMVQKGVSVDVFLHIQRARFQADLSKHIGHEVASFFAANWPFGTPHPVIYTAPRTIDPQLKESMHAKCVVVDERVAIVGSANFTDRGQSRNIEVGARIEDAGFAQALVGQFRAATHAGLFQKFLG